MFKVLCTSQLLKKLYRSNNISVALALTKHQMIYPQTYRNKGCTREFLYIRNSNPRLKLALLAEKCAAGMHVNTHSCPLRTEKLTKFHRFLSRLTLTSEGGELVNPQKTKIHNETQKICVISLRRSRGRMILNARKC